MQFNRYIIKSFFFLILCQISISSFGQLGVSFDIKKPKEYDERVLRSEKSDQKKFNLPRRFIQNTVTHYNYFFNANNKLNEVLEKAKTAFTDDYSQLLPFYNFSLDVTAQDSIQLDSISYKSSTGIALHDLRSDWADNLYLLWGAAFYLRKEFDSAYLMFQFINYAFAPKEKDGYYRTIGSKMDGNTAFSIASKEKNSIPRKIFAEPPSRNDAFIWQIRNFLAQDQLTEAASLIITLRNDPVFPKRLQNDLQEVQAFWFYKQNMWDSAAAHLEEALGNATTKQEKVRWEFLTAQLYELTKNYKTAEKYYTKVIHGTTDPIMDIYARLFSIRVNKDDGDKAIERNINELVKMAHRDKYEEYRDIIYYMAAQMQLERNNPDGAEALLLKSTQYANNNPAQRNKAFLQLAEMAFAKRKYRQSYNYYDSLRYDDPSLKDVDAITARKNLLGSIAGDIDIIARQDSLQYIALIPEEQRRELVKKLVKQLRKEQGLKDESNIVANTASPFANISNTPPANLFPAESKGEWYFYNSASRARGKADFRNTWGDRPNLDNWRRGATIDASLKAKIAQSQAPDYASMGGIKSGLSTEISFDALYNNLPLTPELLKVSSDSIRAAMFELGKSYIQGIEDCQSGTETYELFRSRFPDYDKMDEVLFNLYYCYNKNGETAKAAGIKQQLNAKYPHSNFTTIVTTGKNPKALSGNSEATKSYEDIYETFIEGKFDQAIAQKKIADSIYGKSYWTPQLLYIEAVYFIKQRQDSTAKVELANIISQFNGTPLANKATTLLDVLNRRKQIEEELTNLVINRPPEDTARYTITPPVRTLVPKDSVGIKIVPPPVVVNNKPPVVDTVAKKPIPKEVVAGFTFNPADAYSVLLILNKVDPVFVNEAKNAFFRYNRDAFPNKILGAELVALDGDNALLLISGFKNAQEAVDYVERTRPRTATEIVPWLKGGKYTFSAITDKNLEVLKSNKNIEGYKAFLNQNLPGKF